MTQPTLDPVLGDIAAAWDPAVMLRMFRMHAPIHRTWTLSDLVVQRVRHRVSRRCIVQYSATFTSEAGRRWCGSPGPLMQTVRLPTWCASSTSWIGSRRRIP
jgi:hypothetical protein